MRIARGYEDEADEETPLVIPPPVPYIDTRFEESLLDRLVTEPDLQPDLPDRLTLLVQSRCFTHMVGGEAGRATFYAHSVQPMMHGPLCGANLAGDLHWTHPGHVEPSNLLVHGLREPSRSASRRRRRVPRNML